MQIDAPLVGVAPMEGVTIFPTRLWLAAVSQPAQMTTPFLRAIRPLLAERQLPAQFIPELAEVKGCVPYQLTPQLMAGEEEPFLHVSALLRHAGAETIELNCGCPSPAAVGRHAGSGILRDPDNFSRTISRYAAALGPHAFAVKMRIGFHQEDELSSLLPAVSSLPLARLTVHGRTRADGYRGHARWEAIERVAQASVAPTWASGDIVGQASFERLQAVAPSIVGAMVGRGLLANPWIFEELRKQAVVAIDASTLAHALLCFALLHQLWLTSPKTLLTRVANGRYDFGCGTDPQRWERQTAQLSNLVFGFPCVLSPQRDVPSLPLSPTVVERVRYLWNSLRWSLPEAFQSQKLLRLKRLDEFLQALFTVAGDSLVDEPGQHLEASEALSREPSSRLHLTGLAMGG